MLHTPETTEVHRAIEESYKKRLGEIEGLIEKDDEEKNTSFERSFLHNAIYLHSLWFEQLEGGAESEAPFLEEILKRRESDINTFIKWLNVFAFEAKPNGWAIWGWSSVQKTFVGFPIKGHDVGVPLGVTPLLVLDCWEHSYLADYGLEFQDYLDIFWRDLNWEKIDTRHKELAKLFGFNLK